MALIVGTNSYISVDDADDYFSDRIYSEKWSSSTDENKSKALIMANKLMKSLNWVGYKYEEDQLMDWPRIDTNINGLEDDEVPDPIKEGQCEYAFAIIKKDITNNYDSDLFIVSSRAGDTEIQYDVSLKSSVDIFSYAKQLMSLYFNNSLELIRS